MRLAHRSRECFPNRLPSVEPPPPDDGFKALIDPTWLTSLLQPQGMSSTLQRRYFGLLSRHTGGILTPSMLFVSADMRIVFLSIIAILLVPHDAYADDPSRRDWLLCQAGHVERCEQLLRTSLDDEMRMLVEIDRRIAMEKSAAYARLFMHECDRRSNVRACDRALTYNLSAQDRQEAVNMRNAVMQRNVIRVSK